MKRLFLLLFLMLFFTTHSFAWGKKGHIMVAEAAFNQLDAATKKKVLFYLDGMTIQQAATWMDEVSQKPGYGYMKTYHYVNFNKGEKVTLKKGNNILSVLDKTIRELQNKKQFNKAQIRTKLLFLFHLIGDVHQPLHVGYGYDKGGNKTQLNYKNQGTNLHAFWDSGIIRHKKINLKDCLSANPFSKTELTNLQKINVVTWAQESNNLLNQCYAFQKPKVSQKYVDHSAIIVKKQIAKAGVRLAAVLRTVLK
ncbi:MULTISPECIES: S1/P1 nuclease [unclassified Flavobacterium]|uniref:S1/P1 nuclease n=1 Tax=unclassified Flavobacterium TaxID=196869 RepID=UPI000EAF3E02|nr:MULTISPECIES: S1/P1 nuclease [unclassified Flavobacterium]RKS03180.1 S1/P1 nuclease [Flavobacterium sp. 102]